MGHQYVTHTIQADLIWRLGLRDAVEANHRFSPIHYYSSNAALAPVSGRLEEMEEEIQSILKTSIAVNVFWCSSRKKTTECKDRPKTKSSPNNIDRSISDLPVSSKWRRCDCLNNQQLSFKSFINSK